jgi:phosphatidylinositol alpha-mannosyltransferase
MRLRILQVSDAYYPFPGGVSEHMHHLSLALRERGHLVKILTGSYGEDDKNYNGDVIRVGKVILTSPKLRIFNLTQLTLSFSPTLHLQVRNLLRKHSFHIVHTHGPLAVNLPHLALHYSRSVNVATFHTAFIGFNFHKIGRIFFYKSSKKIYLAIGVSEVALRPLIEVYSMPYRIIPNGIDLKRFNPGVKPIEELVRLKGMRILFLGRMEPRKGLPLLIEALKHLKKEIPDLWLIVGGTGPLENEYKRLAQRILGERAIFLGYIPREKVPSLYRSVHLYTSPAVGGETFGIVLLEAMASGIPVVASNIPGYRTILRDGVNGLLAEVDDPMAYAKILKMALINSELRERLIEEGLETARDHSWERIAEEVEDAYFEAMERAGLDRLRSV